MRSGTKAKYSKRKKQNILDFNGTGLDETKTKEVAPDVYNCHFGLNLNTFIIHRLPYRLCRDNRQSLTYHGFFLPRSSS